MRTFHFEDPAGVHQITTGPLPEAPVWAKSAHAWACACGARSDAAVAWSEPGHAAIMGAHHVREAIADMVAVGEPKPTPRRTEGKPGWAWGSSSGGKWLTIAGSAYETPRLAATPADAGPCQFWFSPSLALVVPVFHAGVTITQTGFWILQIAEPELRA